MGNIKNMSDVNEVDVDRVHTPLFISMLLVLLSSTIKPTESFFEGADRYFSPIVDLLAKLSSMFAVVAMFISGVLYFIYHVKHLEQPRLCLSVCLFLVLKVLSCMVFLYYGALTVNIILSTLIVFIFTSFILSSQVRYGGVFEMLVVIFAVYACFFSLVNVYEFLVNSSAVLWAGRLYGVTNHPNFIGGYSAILMPFVLYSILSFGNFSRYIFGFCSLLLLSLVLFSGSRSSLLSLVLGSCCFFILNFGLSKAIVYSVFLSFLFTPLALAFGVFGDLYGFSLERLLSTENTREYVIFELWSVFVNNPIFGNPIAASSTSNSYLLVLARFGLVGGVILGGVIFVALKSAYQLVVVGEGRGIGSAYISSLVVILSYSIFEGVLVENYSMGQIVFFVCLTYLGCPYKNKKVIS